MRKIYLLVLLLALLASTSIFAQRQRAVLTQTKHLSKKLKFGAQSRTAAGCDTINFPVPDEWNPSIYGVSNNGGIVTGNNRYHDLEKAAFFDVSNTSDQYLKKVFIYFAYANSNVPANLTKVVPIHVYAGDLNDGPTTIIATVNKSLAQLKADVNADNLTEVEFPDPVTLPASKTFFISVDISDLAWNNSSSTAEKDTLGIVSTTDGDPSPDNNGLFVERFDNGTWASGDDSWSLDLNLFIFPVLGASADCGTLPIVLSSFTGEKVASTNILRWITQTEINNRGFDIERSADGVHFSSIAFSGSKAAHGLSTSALQYTFQDTKPLNGTNYYRLKQSDKDGKLTYSAIVVLKGSRPSALQIGAVYPNPVKSMLNVMVTSAANEKVLVAVTDLAGKTLLQQSIQAVAGENQVSLNVNRLAAGSYVLRVAGSETKTTATGKFMKN